MDEVEGSAAARSLTELIERLEKLEGPDRNCDLLCWAVLKGYPFDAHKSTTTVRMADGSLQEYRSGSGNAGSDTLAVPFYTASLDAALTLVPDGIWWLFAKGRTRPNEPLYGIEMYVESDPIDQEALTDAEHDNPAIALCIAALKARSAQVRTAAPKSTLGD